MSFNRLNWDPCTYKYNVNQSVDAATYGLQTPRPDCAACFPADTNIQHGKNGFPIDAQGGGISQCATRPMVDVDSEMRRLNKPGSRCPVEKYIPNEDFCGSYTALRDCRALPVETTRISNPPCTLRSTGWNRWEWLCKNPQDKSLIPFDYGISSRTVIKDNHRPCIEEPINQAVALPADTDDVYKGAEACQWGHLPNFTSTHWRTCCEMAPYLKV